MEFFDKFCDPTTIGQLTLSQKMLGSLFLTLLGMGTTFIGLIVIQYMIQLTSKVIKRIESGKNKESSVQESTVYPPKQAEVLTFQSENNGPDMGSDTIDEELVAVITAAVAAMMGQKTNNIIISNIRRVEPMSSAWATAGRAEQLGSRF